MRISDWSSDVCSSDLSTGPGTAAEPCRAPPDAFAAAVLEDAGTALLPCRCGDYPHAPAYSLLRTAQFDQDRENPSPGSPQPVCGRGARLNSRRQTHHTSSAKHRLIATTRSEEHTSELQSLMRNSYAVFCLKKKNK